MVANGHFERPFGFVLLEFKVTHFQFRKCFKVKKDCQIYSLACASNGDKAHFDIRQGIITIPYLSMELRPEHTTNTRARSSLLTETTLTLQPEETLAISSKIPYLIDQTATGVVTTFFTFSLLLR